MKREPVCVRGMSGCSRGTNQHHRHGKQSLALHLLEEEPHTPPPPGRAEPQCGRALNVLCTVGGKLRGGGIGGDGVTDPGAELRWVAPSAGFQMKLDLMSNIICTICFASLCDWFVQRGRHLLPFIRFCFFFHFIFLLLFNKSLSLILIG